MYHFCSNLIGQSLVTCGWLFAVWETGKCNVLDAQPVFTCGQINLRDFVIKGRKANAF